MVILDGQALAALNGILGTTGGEEKTFLDDGNLQLSLDATHVIRRSRTVGGSSGIFVAKLANVHAGSDSVSLTVDPYALTGAVQAGYPKPVPVGFDVWLLDVLGTASADAMMDGGQTPSWVFLLYPAVATVLGTAGSSARGVRGFADQLTFSGSARVLLATQADTFGRALPIRIPRGTLLGWNTTALAVAGTLQCNAVLGLFPAGLGHDCEG